MSSLKDRIKAAKRGTPQKLKPLVTSWMLENQNHEWSDAAIDVAVETLKRARRMPQYMRNSPSAGHFDNCDRRAVIAFNGHKSDPIDDVVTLGKFADGNYGHLMWQLRLFDMGFMAAEHVEMFVSVPHWGVAGTCDGVISVPMEGWNPTMGREEARALVDSGEVPVWWSLLEVKRMASYRFRSCVANDSTEDKITWQGANYWMGANKKLHPLFSERNRGEAVQDICYWHENKDTNEFIEFDIVPGDGQIRQMHEFYAKVLNSAGGQQLPERPFQDEDKWSPCNRCNMRTHCLRLERKGKTTLGPASGKKWDKDFPEI